MKVSEIESFKAKLREFLKSHRYALVLLYIPCYLLYFGILELFPHENIHIIHCPLDALIPTIPAFFLPYAFWWILFPGALLYFLFFGSKKEFLRLCFILFGGYTVCLIVYTVWPNGIEIRQPLPGHDFFSWCIRLLRLIDPPQNVCPSMHVSSTVAIDITVQGSRKLSRPVKIGERIVAVLIILATVLIKQHSVVDVVLGIVLSLVLDFVWRGFVEARVKD
jgi:hypothetical protein